LLPAPLAFANMASGGKITRKVAARVRRKEEAQTKSSVRMQRVEANES